LATGVFPRSIPDDGYTPRHLAEKVLTSRAAIEGERKQVTVLFCDITDSTGMAERVGPERMHTVLNRFVELALGEVHRYEGTVNQFLGDGFMALFGAPIAHEDHADRAVLAALSLQRHLEETVAGDGSDLDVRLSVRMGLNTGPVVVGGIGDNLRMDYTAVGDTTNLAARLLNLKRTTLIEKLKRFLDYFPPKIDEYTVFLEKNRIWVGRTKGVAIISAEDAVSFGLSGPPLRGSGVDYDLRKAEPYSAYPKCEFSVPLGKNGDTYDRYWIRVQEFYESVKIIRQCLEQMQDGPVMADVPSVTLPPKQRVFTNLESMIQQFKLFSQGFDAPPGEIYCGTEAHKGELGFYIVSMGGGKPYRLKIRAPSFIHMGAFDHMSRGYMISDAVTIFGTYDIVMGECDR
jgi:class 3 adenylate cyclase